MEVFLWIFHGKTTRKKSTYRENIRFHASCGKISTFNFQKENNVLALIRETLQLCENMTLSK